MKTTKSVLLIYTGGTIGMLAGQSSDALIPVEFNDLDQHIPELSLLDCTIDHIALNRPKDSSNIESPDWMALQRLIIEKKDAYFGFVVLHGTDTMSYAASMASFLLLNLKKPVIFTGSQLPIGTLRTDAKENLITAIEIASTEHNGAPLLQEVAIYFEYKLYRANRSTKINAHHFQAFDSPNYPWLMRSGVHMEIQNDLLLRPSGEWKDVVVGQDLEQSIYVITLYPNMPDAIFNADFSAAKAVILETFGSGNSMQRASIRDFLKRAAAQGLPVINVSQCLGGAVEMGRYAASNVLLEGGVINGYDMTLDSALAKAQYLAALGTPYEVFKKSFVDSLCGEISVK